MTKTYKIAVIGLGYVGLPLAVEFSKKYITIGFDINLPRVKELKKGLDYTKEVDSEDLKAVLLKDSKALLKAKIGLLPTNDILDLQQANVFIVTVPTPIDKDKNPVLKPLIESSKTVGKLLKKGDIVIYESTVYPGVTEDQCVPVLEAESG